MGDVDNKTKIFVIEDFSRGVQRKSTRFQRAQNEVVTGENASFDNPGGFSKKLGYTQEGDDLTSTTTTSTSTSTTTTSTSTSSSTSTSTSTTTTA